MELKEYDVFILTKDLNSTITKGMRGVILIVYDMHNFEVEFVDPQGYSYMHKGQSTFTIDETYIQKP